MESEQRETIGELIGQLRDDAKAYAAAELGYYRELAGSYARDAQGAALFGAIALVFAFVAVIVLVIGALITLIPQVGPLLATIIVTVATLLVAALFGWLAWAKIKAMMERRA